VKGIHGATPPLGQSVRRTYGMEILGPKILVMFREESQSEAEEIEKLIDERNEVLLWQLDLDFYVFWSGRDIFFWAPKQFVSDEFSWHLITVWFFRLASNCRHWATELCKPSNWIQLAQARRANNFPEADRIRQARFLLSDPFGWDFVRFTTIVLISICYCYLIDHF